MRFGIAEIVAYLSRHLELRPGDLIATGTPPRLASPPGPDRRLRAGDTVTVSIEGIGRADHDHRLSATKETTHDCKPPTVFLGEMTDPEVEAFLSAATTVIVPTGSTEQHGPHGPLLTDVLVPNEVARRVAPEVGAVVAPADQLRAVVPARRASPGLVHIRIPTFMALVEDLCALAVVDRLPADRVPQRPLRQHVRHRLCLRQRRRAPAAPAPTPSRSTTGTA